jgi:NAD-dependent protein deacetylase/lipoamidase
MTPAQLARILDDSSNTVALTGAGISTAAGIPDFRGPKGIYVTRQYDAEKTFDISCFRDQPEHFYAFTRDLLTIAGKIKPTFTHRLLAKLEERKQLAAVITQNIDPLHQDAGSRQVIAVHGNYHTSTCLACGRKFSYQELLQLLEKMKIPRCQCSQNGLIKPDVVFFGEPVPQMQAAAELVSRCQVLLVLGSSLTVFPVAALPQMAPGQVIIVNKGGVAIPAAENYTIIDSDLDSYFRAVAEQLGVACPDSQKPKTAKLI